MTTKPRLVRGFVVEGRANCNFKPAAEMIGYA